MPLAVRQQETVGINHRVNFVGKASGPNTLSWEYKVGDVHVVKRPDDGAPAKQWRVKCRTCKANLRFTVHSVQATRRRQARLRAMAWASLVFVLACGTGCFFVGEGGWLFVLFFSAFLGVGAISGFGQYAGAEVGFSGHGAGKAYAAKHSLKVLEDPPDDLRPKAVRRVEVRAVRPDDLPVFVCGKCGHEEDYAWEGGSEAWLDRQQSAARRRMVQHTCDVR